jgi:PAS domain S-box-containing protein
LVRGEREESSRRCRYLLAEKPISLEIRSRVVRDPAGGLLCVRGTAQDVSHQDHAQQELAGARDFFQATLDSLSAHIAVLDQHGEIVMTNRAWLAFAAANDGTKDGVSGNYLAACESASNDELATRVAAGLQAITSGQRSEFSLEYPCHSPTVERWFLLRAQRYEGPGEACVVVAHLDISERIVAERALLAAQDYTRAVAENMGEGLFTIDTAGCITYINPAGESLLGWPPGDLQGRVMHDALHRLRPDGSKLPIEECPMMRAIWDGTNATIDDDLFVGRDRRQLPVAYTAAPFETGRGVQGCVVVFHDITQRKAHEAALRRDAETLAWIGRIRDALACDRFVLYSQPIIEIRTGATVQQELLLRMREPDGRIITPDCYLHIAEEYGLVGKIDRWVIARAAEIAATGSHIEINISARTISEADVLEHLELCLETSGADPALIVFEITETAIIQDEPAAFLFAERFHALGCKLALDDFGTGYGSFTYLKQLPVDYLKIDIEFVRDLVNNAASRHVVKAVVALAGNFDLQTVAEGVEDATTLELLRDLGVDYAQGFFLARPRPLVDGNDSTRTQDATGHLATRP